MIMMHQGFQQLEPMSHSGGEIDSGEAVCMWGRRFMANLCIFSSIWLLSGSKNKYFFFQKQGEKNREKLMNFVIILNSKDDRKS